MGRKKRKPITAEAQLMPSITDSTSNTVPCWEMAKNKGNLLYGQCEYDKALEQYMKAMTLLELSTLQEGMFIVWQL